MANCLTGRRDVSVIRIGMQRIDLNDGFHLVIAHSSLVIIVPRHKTPWDVVIVHH